MTWSKAYGAVLLCLFCAVGAAAQLQLGSTPARLVAPGVISTNAYEGSFAITSDGKTLYFSRFGAERRQPILMQSQWREGRWTEPQPAPVPAAAAASASFCLAPDDKRLIYVAPAPPDDRLRLWQIERTENEWSAPSLLSGPWQEWDTNVMSPAITRDGTLFFSAKEKARGNWDIYESRLQNGVYGPAVLVGAGEVSTIHNEPSLSISPEGKRLLFSSVNAPNGQGEGDLYEAEISGDRVKSWNMGPGINSALNESNPHISGDGSRLYFTRRGDLYEIDIAATKGSSVEPCVWRRRAAMTNGRFLPRVAVFDHKIFSYGGETGSGRTLTFEEYDPVLDRWRSLQPGPAGWETAAFMLHGGKLLLLRTETGEIAEFDPARNVWDVGSSKAKPMALSDWHQPALLGTKAYFSNRTDPLGTFTLDAAYTFVEYDLVQQSWTEKPLMQFPAHFLVSFQDQIYAAGAGVRGDKLQAYDPAKAAWTEKRSTQVGRFGPALTGWRGELWVIGGHGLRSEGPSAGNLDHTVMRYDPVTDQWRTGPDLPVGRYGAAAAAVDGRLFLVGGFQEASDHDLSALQECVLSN